MSRTVTTQVWRDVEGLGWPGAQEEFSTGLGWPTERERPQNRPSFPQDPAVSRETNVAAYEPVVDVDERTEPSSETFTGDQPEPEPFNESAPVTMAPVRLSTPLPRPERTRVLVVANQKGGVGKTTTAVNVAAALALNGARVLLIDLDPQGNASTALGIAHHRGVLSSYDVLVDGTALAEAQQEHPDLDGLSVVPATIDLAGAEIELVNVVARENRLTRALKAHPLIGTSEDRFDYVFIDCPPSLGLLTLNALVAGEEMFIPIQAEYYALEGLGQLLETIEMVRTHLNDNLRVGAILLTMYDARTKLAAGVADEVRAHFPGQVLKTAVPRSVRVSEAPSYGQTVMTYDPSSPGALSYLQAARELAHIATTDNVEENRP